MGADGNNDPHDDLILKSSSSLLKFGLELGNKCFVTTETDFIRVGIALTGTAWELGD